MRRRKGDPVTAIQWAATIYAAIGALFGGYCSSEVEREKPHPLQGSGRWWFVCICAALTVSVLWLPIVIWSLVENDSDG